MSVHRIVFFGIVIVLLTWGFTSPVAAQIEGISGLGVSIAYGLPVNADNVQTGHIVALHDGEYVLSGEPYDATVIGVVDENPALSVTPVDETGSFPVVSQGRTMVLVNQNNGDILKGDMITTSADPGVGMKADENSGFVVGQALADASFGDQETALVLTVVRVYNSAGYSEIMNQEGVAETPEDYSSQIKESITDIFNVAADEAYKQPSLVYRYTLAAAVIILALLFAFFGFARIAQKGIEAIGRNPMAKRAIMIGVVLNIVIAVVIVFAGIVVAYYIIRL